jgi:hypothetical protein
MHEISVCLASSDKWRVSVTSQPQHSNVDLLFDFWGPIHIEQSLPYKKKISVTLTLERTWCACFGLGRLGRLPLRRLTFHFWIIFIKLCLLTCDDVFHDIRILFCLLKEISGNAQAVFLLLNSEDTNEFCRNALHVQILCQNGLVHTVRYANLCKNFTHCKSPISRN